MKQKERSHWYIDSICTFIQPLIENFQDLELAQLRDDMLRRRDIAIPACMLEVFVALISTCLYFLRRTFVVVLLNVVIITLALIGLVGAIQCRRSFIFLHAVVTCGLLASSIVFTLLEFAFTSKSDATGLPDGVVLILFILPYSLDLACSVMNLRLGLALESLLERDPFSAEKLQTVIESADGTCCICMVAASNSAFFPCGHKCCCSDCAQKMHGRRCPICRVSVRSSMRIYES